YSYVSVTEISRHRPAGGSAGDRDGGATQLSPYLQRRLQPSVPRGGYACFYPMSKKRDGGDNWYMLPLSRRADLMESHGEVGRRYAGRVTQVITGSTGLDDWEWGVTLFADDPVEFKRLVYEMRFDEASARYGE